MRNSDDPKICFAVKSDASLVAKDPACEKFLIVKEALDLVNDDTQTHEEYSQKVLCNVKTLLEMALADVLDVNGAAYAVDRALSQLGCSSPGDSVLCKKLFEAKNLL